MYDCADFFVIGKLVFFFVSALYIRIKLLLLYRINDVMTKLRYLSVIPLAGLKMLTLF